MTNKTDAPTYKGFKLISLELTDTTIMGKSKLYYDFIEPDDEQNSIYTTVLIGANGTGKSNLFRIIIELFKELNDLQKGNPRTYRVDGGFNLKYSLEGNIYEYSNLVEVEKKTNKKEHKTAQLRKNDKQIGFDEAVFPSTLVANSISLTDKYPFFKQEKTADGLKIESFPIYKYLGVRNIAQNASTRAYVRKTVEFIVQEFKSPAFRKGLKKATDFLCLDNEIDIFYYTSNTTKFFKGNLTPADIVRYFEEINTKYSDPNSNPPYKLNYYLKIKDNNDLLLEISSFCNKLATSNRLKETSSKYSSIRKIVYNLINDSSLELLNNEFSLLEQLRLLGMIYSPEIELKRNEGYSLQESSSGEYHFFSSIVGLMATVKPNSIVFIDEPEISLHPNWQMKYLTFLRELFAGEEYATSHILVATHSHFVISDLKGISSKIIGLKRENNNIVIVDLPEKIDTYCWSPDDVLYNIFDVTSSRNVFVAEKIANILEELSRGSKAETNKISTEIYDTLMHLEKSLKEKDPLKEVVKSILKRIIS